MIVFICIWFHYFKKKYWFSPVKGSNFSSYFFNDEISHDATAWNKNIFPENCCRNWEAEETNSDYYKLQLKINSAIVQMLLVLL